MPHGRIIQSRVRVFAGMLAIALVAVAGAARANHSRYEQLSAGQINGNGAFPATFDALSADGQRAIFHTDEPLVSTDTDASRDIYMRAGGVTTRISAGQINGNGAFTPAFERATADASRILFITAEPLVAADTDAVTDVYERVNGTTLLISRGQINGNGPVPAISSGMSTDGKKVFFTTQEQLVAADTDSVQDVYERSNGTTKLISAGQINGNGPSAAFFSGASSDGSRVFFITNEPLVTGDTDIVNDVYQRFSGTTTRISTGPINGNGAFAANFEGASADGQQVVFETDEQLVSGDGDSQTDVYKRAAGTTSLVSAGQINGNGAFAATFRDMATDGSPVFFGTAESLVPGDSDTSTDIYKRGGATTSLVSAGQINGNLPFNVVFTGATPDGAQVFFRTSEPLVAADSDTSIDIYKRASGTTSRMSAGQINGNGAFDASFAGASTDGKRVFFTTGEPLVPADTDASVDIYERASGLTSLVSPGSAVTALAFNATSADGGAVAYTTAEKVLASDTDSSNDVYGAYVAP
jgi:hypothetical protein